jgi:neutral ceramidase
MSVIRFLSAVGLALVFPHHIAANGATYRVGVAKVDITPRVPIWLAGYADRRKPSEGIDQPLFLKALAVQEEKGAPLILITADLIGFPQTVTDEIANRLHKQLGIPRDNFLMIASHTHTGPVIHSNLKTMFELKGEDGETVQAYTRQLPERALEAVTRAVRGMEPARISYSRGKATFAVNRRVFKEGGVNFGANWSGAVDHEVPVLRVEDSRGTVHAILFGYACHCTTLTGSWNRIGGDWAGYAQEFLERAYPRATAFFLTGCGADSDPQPRGKLDYAMQHGLEIAGAVSQALTGPQAPIGGRLQTAFDRVELPLATPPPRDFFEKRLHDPSEFVSRHARRQLDILSRDGKFPMSYPGPVQVWQLGKELTLVALGGEVVVDYALRIKRELPRSNVWVTGYSNEVFAYVPSVRILLEGGYEADQSMIYYGLPTRFSNAIEEILIRRVAELAERVRP